MKRLVDRTRGQFMEEMWGLQLSSMLDHYCDLTKEASRLRESFAKGALGKHSTLNKGKGCFVLFQDGNWIHDPKTHLPSPSACAQWPVPSVEWLESSLLGNWAWLDTGTDILNSLFVSSHQFPLKNLDFIPICWLKSSLAAYTTNLFHEADIIYPSSNCPCINVMC